MHTVYTGHVDRAEWQWVIGVTLTLLLVLFLPFILIALLNPPSTDWQFVGALHDYQNSAANLSRIQQGADGNLLVRFLHTPEAHAGALIHPLYALLGQLSRVTLRSTVNIFHIARMIAAFFMFLTIYQLGASIWIKIRTRRIFFVIASVGAGFGWLVALMTGLTGNRFVPDLMLPQAFPLYSAAVNVHYPIMIGCVSLLSSALIAVCRPGMTDEPGIDNGGVMVFLASLVLAIVYPEALLPLVVAYIGSVIAQWVNRHNVTLREWRWALWLVAPALPVIAYNILTVVNNEIVAQWIAQRSEMVVSLPMLLISLGLPLLIALPGLWRAIRHFEADGDRFMLLWLGAMLVATWLPPLRLHHYYLAGLMLPIAYFAARSVEDVWFGFVKRRYRWILYVSVTVVIVLSPLLWLMLPVVPIVQGWSNVDANVLEQGYTESFRFLDDFASSEDVILASPGVSTWIPLWVEARVVYGHPHETIDAETKRADVLDWYRLDTSTACQDILTRYSVDFVLVGTRELTIGAADCAETLTFFATFNNVDVFAVQN